MPKPNEEIQHDVVLQATLRRIADALDEIAGTLTAIWNASKEESEVQDD